MKQKTSRARFLGASALFGISLFGSACAVDLEDESLTQKDQELIGGQQAAPYHKRATVYMTFSNGASCTGAKVGERLFLTAAHCVDDAQGEVSPANEPGDGITISNDIVQDGTATRHQLTIAETSIHPSWTAACADGCSSVIVLDEEHAPDIAVVEVLEDTPGIPQENVDLGPVAAGESASKSGYGCEQSVFGPSANPPRFKTENAQVLTTADYLHAGSFATDLQDASELDASYVATMGFAAESEYHWDWASLCPGDSGGPLYSSTAGRGIIGVNAYYTFGDGNGGVSLRDWHTRTGNQTRYNVGSWLESLGVNTVGGGVNEGAGGITMERWNNISGVSTNDIPLNQSPNQTGILTAFEVPTDVGDNYGVRVRGYLTAPKTGGYQFYVAGDDHVELYLSSDTNLGNKSLIAHHNGWTNPHEWGKYSSQESNVIQLVAGQSYYIEALMKEAGGGDNLAVGWLQPGQIGEEPFQIIPGYQLSPM